MTVVNSTLETTFIPLQDEHYISTSGCSYAVTFSENIQLLEYVQGLNTFI